MNIVNSVKITLSRQYARLYPRDMFIAVAGSIGKTTCIRAASRILSKKYKTLHTPLFLDPTASIPATLLHLNPSIKKMIAEMGIKRRGEMDFYLSLVKPQTAIFTKITFANSETLGSLNEILYENAKLSASLPPSGKLLLNWDDPSCRKLAQSSDAQVFYYGSDPENCTIWGGNVKIENLRTTFELNLGVERVKVNLQLLGLHHVYPCLAAALLGTVNNIPLTKIKIALEEIEPLDHTLQVLPGPNGSLLLDDTFSSTPEAVEMAIDSLLQIPSRRRVIVLGEMRGLGEYSESLHRKIAQRIYKEKLDLVFLGQGDAQFIADELKSLGFWEERIEVNLQNSQLVSKLLKTLDRGDICLIKGSRSLRLDEVVKRISKKQQYD